jgi:hypothetical protein
LDDIKDSLSELDNYLTITEDMINHERDLDRELYRREREIKYQSKSIDTVKSSSSSSSSSTPSPKLLHRTSRLRFEDGKVKMADNGQETLGKKNIEMTHQIVKQIISNENKYACYDNYFDITDELEPVPENKILSCSNSKNSDSISLNTIESRKSSRSSNLSGDDQLKLSEEAEIFFATHEHDDNGKYKSFDDSMLRSPTSMSPENRFNFSSLPIVPAEVDDDIIKKFYAAKSGADVKKSSPM